jgi:hypothetical protein
VAHGEDGGSLLPSFHCVYAVLNSVSWASPCD